MKEQLQKSINGAVLAATDLSEEEVPAFNVEVPANPEHGDFATNVAMLLAKRLKQAPRKIAESLLERLAGEAIVDRVEVAGPGFINFFIDPDAWRAVLVQVLAEGSDYGRSRSSNPERVMVEFVSANPTGPLHFGHGRGAVVGDVLANLLEATGHQVTREFYVNDAGNQVNALARSVLCRMREQAGLEAQFPEDGYRGDYVRDLAARVPDSLRQFLPGEPSTEQLQALQDFCVDTLLEAIQVDLQDFGVRMENYASEQVVIDSGKIDEAFALLKKAQATKDEDGAYWFNSDQYGDEKARVLVKSDGSRTYFATDIAYHLDKLQRGYQRLINIWGADHHGYVPRMKASLSALGHPPEALEVLLVQMVSLVRDGKPVVLSKREGEIITLRQVVEEVGRDAARFFFLLRGTDSQMEFDLELAKKRSIDNPVFYVQYGHARLCSILAKAAERNIPVPEPGKAASVDLTRLTLDEELSLIKKMGAYAEVLQRAACTRAPHQLVFYLQELVGDFHHYYTAYSKTSPILSSDPDLVAARLILVQALRTVLRCGLSVLGVSAPDRMESPEAQEAG